MIDYGLITKELFRGTLPDWQREPVDAIIAAGLKLSQSRAAIAYVLATAYHETGRFRFMEEIRPKKPTKAYWKKHTLPDGTRVSYHGRGYVQLTWKTNYEKMERRLGVSLVTDPDAAKNPVVAARILWVGMLEGIFTGKKLSDYIGEDRVDFYGARRTVNGTDKAAMIAKYAETFLCALSPKKAKPAAAKPTLAAGAASLSAVAALGNSLPWWGVGLVVAGILAAAGVWIALEAWKNRTMKGG